MKNKLFVVIILLGGCLWMGWSSQTSFKKETKTVHRFKPGGEVTTSPPSLTQPSLSPEIVEVKGSIDEMKAEYLEKLNLFREATKEYNRKAIRGLLEENDKLAYQTAERNSWKAYQALERHIIEELKQSKGN